MIPSHHSSVPLDHLLQQQYKWIESQSEFTFRMCKYTTSVTYVKPALYFAQYDLSVFNHLFFFSLTIHTHREKACAPNIY